MNILKPISASIFTLSLLFCLTPSAASAWVLVLNGTSSAGKTTLARNLQKIMRQPTEILQIDTECDQAFKETLEAIGYHHDGKTDFWDWVDSLSKEVTKKIDEDALWKIADKRIIEKAQKLNYVGSNVIVDTVLEDEDSCKLLANGLHSTQTYFILVYAPIDQLLKNLVVRNNSDPLLSFSQFFFHFFERCEATSPERLDVLTKKDFEFGCRQFESLIEGENQNDFKKDKSTVDSMFFHTCWGWMPHWLRDWLPCYCGGEAIVGITSKLPYDFVINTGAASSIECAKTLDAWLAGKI